MGLAGSSDARPARLAFGGLVQIMSAALYHRWHHRWRLHPPRLPSLFGYRLTLCAEWSAAIHEIMFAHTDKVAFNPSNSPK